MSNELINDEAYEDAIRQILEAVRQASFSTEEVSEQKKLDQIESILKDTLSKAGIEE